MSDVTGLTRIAPLPSGIRSRVLRNVNGLDMHVLEAGFEAPNRPLVLLLHGFPELAYSWRHVMVPLAEAGYHVVAPDQRGYGRTTGWSADYDDDISTFRMQGVSIDALALINALGHRQVACVVGHDFGSPVAGWCALIRPDVFRAVILMSAPFGGPPALPSASSGESSASRSAPVGIHIDLASLPRSRKHYLKYYTTREANGDMLRCRQGVHAFLRAYYHHKSADWKANRPHALASYTADALAELPTYYVMDRDRTMAETVAKEMPSAQEIAECRWLTEDELRVYVGEFERTGFQGGLNWYRCNLEARFAADMRLFAGRTIDVPSMFIAGRADWGVYQSPGVFERMQSTVCTKMIGCPLLDGAGHWVQQEQPRRVAELMLEFLRRHAPSG